MGTSPVSCCPIAQEGGLYCRFSDLFNESIKAGERPGLGGRLFAKETVAKARKRLAKPQANPAKSEKKKLSEAIAKAAHQAIQLKYQRQAFLNECAAGFKAAKRGR